MERKIYTIDNTAYYYDSFNDEAINVIESLSIIDGEINHNEIQNEIFKVSRGVYSEKLRELLDTFEKVTEDNEDTEEPTKEGE